MCSTLMNQGSDDLRRFAHSFFSNLGCTLREEGACLVVSSIPPEFEATYGKPGPYTLNFDPTHTEGELVARGSYLLKTMTSYLEQRGQTALVKLVFDQDYVGAFKRSFGFRKCELVSITKTPRYVPIYVFSFSTTFHYLNEKEQVMNTVAIHNGEVIPFFFEHYASEQGDPRDISLEGSKSSYEKAKQALKERIESRIADISHVLDEKLIQETTRIKEHYEHHFTERKESIARLREQLANLSPQAPSFAQRKERLVEGLAALEHPDFEARLTQEQEFALRDESYKHALNVSTKLVSTTVVYYPLFSLGLVLKNPDVSRTFVVLYNPLSNDFAEPVVCEHCKHSLREIFLCSSAHVVCSNCFDSCATCSRGVCSLCMKKTCSQCARKVCKRCASRCSFCWKDVCTNHLRTNYATGTEGCLGCLKPCSRCQLFADSAHLRRQANGSLVCLKCATLAGVSFRP